jgi:hypothetical protein
LSFQSLIKPNYGSSHYSFLLFTETVVSVSHKPKRRPYLLKRKALTTGIFDTTRGKDDKDKGWYLWLVLYLYILWFVNKTQSFDMGLFIHMTFQHVKFIMLLFQEVGFTCWTEMRFFKRYTHFNAGLLCSFFVLHFARGRSTLRILFLRFFSLHTPLYMSPFFPHFLIVWIFQFLSSISPELNRRDCRSPHLTWNGSWNFLVSVNYA